MTEYIDFEDMLDQIRIDMYEQTKGMSTADIADAVNERASLIAKQYGFIIVKLPQVKPTTDD
jgi:hypothetical protein